MSTIITAGIAGAVAAALVVAIAVIYMSRSGYWSTMSPQDRQVWLRAAVRASVALMDADDLPDDGDSVFPNSTALAKFAGLMNTYLKTMGLGIRVKPEEANAAYSDLIGSSFARTISAALGQPVPRPQRPTVSAPVESGQ